MDIFVTGLGCLSPIGLNAEQNHLSLKEGKDGLERSHFLDSKYANSKYFGEVKAKTDDLLKSLNVDGIKGLTRTDILAFAAFNEAIGSAQLTGFEIASNDTAFISASTVGGICMTDQLYRNANKISDDPEFVHSYSGAAHVLQIARFYAMKGFTNTINTACSSSANAIMMGMRLIRTGRAKRAIVGGVESMAKYTVNGFNSLQILSNNKCTPFDENRDGLNLGEAAAFLVLEAADVCQQKPKYGKIAGAGNSNDAFHASSLSDEAIGLRKCMELALLDAGIESRMVDFINAHGTGTPNNDQVEVTGFEKLFENVPPFSSTKSYTGHTLAASGALEAIFSLFSLNYNELYPNLHTTMPIGIAQQAMIRQYCDNVTLNVAMSNSYGFGGNCTSLIFTKA
jgi:3-oxoacyl-(acyl-carrier-protein) synthase